MIVRRFSLPKSALPKHISALRALPDRVTIPALPLHIPAPNPAVIAVPIATVAVVATAVVAAPTPAQAADTAVEFKPATMTYTNSAAPTTVYSGASDTIVSASQYATYLKFDTSKFAASTIASAELQVTVTTSQATQPHLRVVSAAAATTNYSQMSYATRPVTTSGELNPNDTQTASAGKTLTTKLTGLINSKPGSWMGLQIGYTAANSDLHLSKSTPPVLRLQVKSGVTETSTVVTSETKPDASNTGPVALGVSSFAASGDVKTTAPGQTISGKNIAGYVTVNHNNTTVRGNIIRGRNAGSYVTSALVKVAPGVTGTVIEYNEIYQYANIGYWQNGVSGSNFTARRNNIHDVVDMFAIDAGGATIEANYLHAFSFYSNDKDHASDQTHPYWTHNDGVQVKGGANSTIRGNSIQMYASKTTGTLDAPTAYNYGAGITVSPDKSAVTALTITTNWIAGGEVGFQANHFYGGGTTGNLGTISSNRMSKDQHYYPIRYKTGYTVTGGTTNYWDPAAPSVPANLAGVYLTTAKGGGIQIDK